MSLLYNFEFFTAVTIYDAIAYVKKHEYRCVNLAEQLQNCICSSDKAPYKSAALLYKEENQVKECKAVLFLSNYNILLHCIDEDLSQETLHAFSTFFFDHALRVSYIHAIIGLQVHTLFFERFIHAAFNIPIAFSQEYYLMECAMLVPSFLDKKLIKNEYDNSIAFEQASTDDIDTLFPLQLAYENTEITYNDITIDPHICKLSLKANIKKNRVYKLSIDSHIVGKAGINAVGINCVQIGGVYTTPEYRNQGLASFLVAHLVHSLLHEKTKAVIFVKCTNHAAIQVYTKIGFKPRDLFRLCYAEQPHIKSH